MGNYSQDLSNLTIGVLIVEFLFHCFPPTETGNGSSVKQEKFERKQFYFDLFTTPEYFCDITKKKQGDHIIELL